MRRHLPVLLVLALVTAVVPAPTAVAQDDAGSGGDAPDYCQDAQTVTLGSQLQGTVDYTGDGDDLGDWYRVEVPEGKLLVVRFTPEDPDKTIFPEVKSDTCSDVGSLREWDGSTELFAVETAGHDAFRIGVETTYGTRLDYTVETALYDVPDPAVTDVQVEKERLGSAGAESPHHPERTVHVTVENVAEGSFPPGFDRSAGLGVEVHHENGDDRDLGYTTFDPWQTQELDIWVGWNTVGEAGNVTVEATFEWEVDADQGNNRGTEASTVLVDGLGTGVDVLNRDDEAGAAGAQASVDADNDRGSDGVVGGLRAPPAEGGGEEVGPAEAGAGGGTSGEAFAYGLVDEQAYVVATGEPLGAFVGAYTRPVWVGAHAGFLHAEAFACTWEPLPQDCTFVMP